MLELPPLEGSKAVVVTAVQLLGICLWLSQQYRAQVVQDYDLRA